MKKTKITIGSRCAYKTYQDQEGHSTKKKKKNDVMYLPLSSEQRLKHRNA